MGKYNISHKLEDVITRDCLKAIAIFEPSFYHVGGGMAVQTYTPEDMHRFTCDIDVSTNGPLSMNNFRDVIQPISKKLEEKGYKTSTNQGGNCYELHVDDEKKNDSIVVQLRQRSKNNYEKNKLMIEREFKHSIINTIGDKDSSVEINTLRPEDIILHKLLRVILFEREYDVTPFEKKSELKEQFDYVTKLREELFERFDNMNPHEMATLRMQCDIFDIHALSEKFNLDKNYFNEASNDWEFVKNNEYKFRKIVDVINPSLL